MIRVMDSSFTRLGVIKNVITASRVEQLNGENTLAFEAVLDLTLNAFISPDTIFELRNDYFDLAMYEKHANEDGTFAVNIEAEQVSYRLNDERYNVVDFKSEGMPAQILELILSGTGFIVGDIDYTEPMLYETGGENTRRLLLMQFATALGGELVFERFTVSIKKHRGSTDRVPVVKDKHVRVISQKVDKRTTDETGGYLTVYDCDSLYLPDDSYSLGDDIRLMERRLSIFEDLRIVSLSYNPYNPMETTFTFASGPMLYYSRGIERIIQEPAEQASVDEEFINERVDDRIDTVLDDKIDDKINEQFDSSFDELFDKRFDKRINEVFIFDQEQGYFVDPETGVKRAIGGISTEIITEKITTEIIKSSAGVLTNFIFTESGVIANAIVRRLRTDLSKPWMYLASDTSDIHYQDIGDTPDSSGRYFKVDICKGGAVPFHIPSINERFGDVPLYWYNGEVGGAMTVNERFGRPPMTKEELEIPEDEEVDPEELFGDPVPVMAFEYEETILHRSESRKTPEGWWDIREQWGNGIDETSRGAGIIEKNGKYIYFGMLPGGGKEIGGYRVSVDDGPEYYDAKTETWRNPGSGSADGSSDVIIERLI